MKGAITGKDVVFHSLTIVRLWGWPTYFSCLKAAITRKPCTFLRVIYPEPRPAGALDAIREPY